MLLRKVWQRFDGSKLIAYNNHYGLPVEPSKFDPVTYRFTLLESKIERMNSNLIKIIESQQKQIDNLAKRII